MAYITLDQAKKHLNLESEFIDDDAYIDSLSEAAEGKVALDICRDLKDLEDEDGDIPAPLRQAVLLQIGDFYASREDTVYGVIVHSTKAYQNLVGLFRNWAG